MSAPTTPTAEIESPYGYIPTTWICIMFIALFGVSTLLHTAQAIKYRIWWLLPTAVLAGIGEVAGWSGRYWSTRNIESDGFTMQITSTIIAPTPLIAANFIILGQVIAIIGPEFSRLAPRLYSRIFLSCDLLALAVQSVGGAMASMADSEEGSDRGGKIMLGGIVFQLVAITAYVAFASEFFTRVTLHKPLRTPAPSDVELDGAQARAENTSTIGLTSPYGKGMEHHVVDRKVKLMVVGLAFSTLVIYIRSIYRTVELTGGWSGRIIQTQVYFNVLDGGMIILAMYTLNVLHPGYLLRK